jgi:hypothetical protein
MGCGVKGSRRPGAYSKYYRISSQISPLVVVARYLRTNPRNGCGDTSVVIPIAVSLGVRLPGYLSERMPLVDFSILKNPILLLTGIGFTSRSESIGDMDSESRITKTFKKNITALDKIIPEVIFLT